MFTAPMLASPLPKNFEIKDHQWAAEEKYDGHRLIVEISQGAASLFVQKGITAWSRLGNVRPLPTHIGEALTHLPDGTYDGELLVPGERSYGVTELVNAPNLVYFVFDILKLCGQDTTELDYYNRRQLLVQIFANSSTGAAVRLAASTLLMNWDHMLVLRNEVWARDGEGLILKRVNAPYQIGKRSKDFIKIKALRSAVLRVIGFGESRGEIIDRGPCAVVLLEDEDGHVTSVKTRNDALCRELAAQIRPGYPHPAIGRALRVEYQERTPDGSYRHIRWDRWEDD